MLSSRRSTANQDAMHDAPKDTMEDDTEHEHGTTTKFHGAHSGPDHYNLTIRDSKGVFHPLGNYTRVRNYYDKPSFYTISCAVSLSCVLCNFVCVCVCVCEM